MGEGRKVSSLFLFTLIGKWRYNKPPWVRFREMTRRENSRKWLKVSSTPTKTQISSESCCYFYVKKLKFTSKHSSSVDFDWEFALVLNTSDRRKELLECYEPEQVERGRLRKWHWNFVSRQMLRRLMNFWLFTRFLDFSKAMMRKLKWKKISTTIICKFSSRKRFNFKWLHRLALYHVLMILNLNNFSQL